MNDIVLQAGPLQMVFVPDEGAVRWIHAGAHEVLRGISAPVRDRGWGTVPSRVEDLEIERGERGFRVGFVARCRGGDVDFRWRGELTGAPDGTLEFTFDGEALADFARNRIGFCVLHPASASGAPCAVEHVDGSVERKRLPEDIAPHQPVLAIRALRHEVAPGLTAEVRMEGDTFEMEDQRNWTDASFKTYCTPLARPFPVVIAQGTRIRQRVRLSLQGEVPPCPPDFQRPWEVPVEVCVTVEAAPALRLPAIGAIWNGSTAGPAITRALQTLGLSHLRLDLRMADERYRTVLESGAAVAAQTGAALELAVFVDSRAEGQLARLRADLEQTSHLPPVARSFVFHEVEPCTPSWCVNVWRRVFAGTRFTAPLGGGATENFTELNRQRAVTEAADFTVHACNPQAHASDDASLFETLPMQALTAAAARRISGGRPVVFSPVSLTRRWRESDPGGPAHFSGALPPLRPDPRLAGPLSAAWLLGSVVALAAEKVEAVTYWNAIGADGLVSSEGRPSAAARLLATLAGTRAAPDARAVSSAPDSLAVLALDHAGQRLVVAGNLRAAPLRVRIEGCWGARGCDLPPYGVMLVSFP